MYKDFYKNEIEKISEILAKDDIHIINVWTNFQKYIYDMSDQRNICTDLIITLDKNPKYMKMIDIEKIKNYIAFNPIRPEFFSLQYKNNGYVKENIDFNFDEYEPGDALISMRIEYKKTKDYDDFDIEIDKDNGPYSKTFMLHVNNIITDLENEFNVDLSSEKFDLTNEEKTLIKPMKNKYSIEKIQEILCKKGEFTYTYKNIDGKESKTIANMIIFSKFINDAYDTNEICVAYEEYDINGIVPISQIINIED